MGNYGQQAQLAADASGATFDGTSEAYEFESETMRKSSQILDTNGIRGTRSHVSERTRYGNDNVSGTVTMTMDPVMLDNWLPRILGGSESADSFALTETLPNFALLIDKVFDVFQYDGCKVSRAVVSASQNSLVTLALDIVGKSETSGKSFPSLTLPTDQPYRFMDGTVTLQGSAREVLDFELIIDNAVNARFTNSQEATDVDPTDRIVTLNCTVPAVSGNSDLYEQSLSGSGGNLDLTNGSLSTTFTFATLQAPDRTPQVQSRNGEVVLPLEMTARKSGGTSELTVTNVSA